MLFSFRFLPLETQELARKPAENGPRGMNMRERAVEDIPRTHLTATRK